MTKRWTARCFHGTNTVEIVDARGKTVVAWNGFDSSDQFPASFAETARLMAAAPELLEACEAAWASWEEAGEFDAFTIPRMMRAAIAKARGEAQ